MATKAKATKAKATKAKVIKRPPKGSTERVLVTTSIKLGVDQRERLRDLARDLQRDGRAERLDVSALIREAIDRYLHKP